MRKLAGMAALALTMVMLASVSASAPAKAAPTRPAPPTGARCVEGGDDIPVSWNASPDVVDAYTVYRGVGTELLATSAPEVVATIEVVAGQTRYEWTDADRPFGTYNRYYVRAVAGGAESRRSNDVICFASDPTPTTKPTNLRVTATEDGLRFEWDPATDESELVSYRLRGGRQGYSRLIAEVSSDVTSVVVPVDQFDAGGEYRFWVRAYDGYNVGGASNAVTLTPTADTTRPGRVSQLTVNVTAFANELEWLPAEDNGGIGHYLVYRSVDGAEFELLHQTFTAWTEWQDQRVEPNRIYAYYLRAVDLAGNIGWRNGIVTVSTDPEQDFAQPDIGRFGGADADASSITMQCL